MQEMELKQMLLQMRVHAICEPLYQVVEHEDPIAVAAAAALITIALRGRLLEDNTISPQQYALISDILEKGLHECPLIEPGAAIADTAMRAIKEWGDEG